MKIISNTGVYASGSSAVSDLLKEYSSAKVFDDDEYQFFQCPFGLFYLEDNLVYSTHRGNSGFSLKLFKTFCHRTINKRSLYEKTFNHSFISETDKYINSLCTCDYIGWGYVDYWLLPPVQKYWFKFRTGINRRLPRFLQKPATFDYLPKEHDMAAFSTKEDFLLKTRAYTDSLFSHINCDGKKVVVFDQLSPSSNSTRFSHYFSDLLTIIVLRDPRDIFCDQMVLNDHCIPRDPHSFVSWYKTVMNASKLDQNDPTKVMVINFEDLIFNYDDSIKKIENFAGLSPKDHCCPRKYFNPQFSQKNTQFWISHPKFKKDCEYITENLQSYLYFK